MSRYPQPKEANYPAFEQEIQQFWEENQIFERSVTEREGEPAFTFYEGPPSANGKPGIHHVLARALKDLFCRYKTLQGFQVKRKAGWDTHGLPIELQVEKKLGITKKDIGEKISVEEYNRLCRESVMEFKSEWDDLTKKMGHWLDLENPYITYDNEYIESCWNLLKRLYDKELLYKGYSIQPYSPAAGTGLSSHELNIPGCYREVKDTSAVACFRWGSVDGLPSYFLAWTTTPWTLASNVALAVGAGIEYADVETLNPYTFERARYVLAQAAVSRYFTLEGENADFDAYLALTEEQRRKAPLPWRLHCTCKGSELAGETYEQLLPFANVLNGEAFKVLVGDFVTTEDGTGIVHIAPTFGADDKRVAEANGFGSVVFPDAQNGQTPMVDRQGKYLETFPEDYQGKDYAVYLEKFAGRYVKDYVDDPNYKNIDVDLSIYLKEQSLAFKVEKYEHSYPHCWRTDKPVLYYPLESWFIKTSAVRDRMVEINKQINWKPASTGTGRFENWLENLVDWNLSRSRYWGTPLPIWTNKEFIKYDYSVEVESQICIGSLNELNTIGYLISSKATYSSVQNSDFAIEEKKKLGFDVNAPLSATELVKLFNSLYLTEDFYNPDFRDFSLADTPEGQKKLIEFVKRQRLDYIDLDLYIAKLVKDGFLIPIAQVNPDTIDFHKPFIDNIILYKDQKIYTREPDLIDVWFDSGAMPFAQWHYPFENREIFNKSFPADFIAEGVDQTRGWFFTLHAIAVMLEDKPAYKNVIANGLVLDKDGRKMSKRWGNAVDPFETIAEFGADATRWYMLENTSPWDNLKFNRDYLAETQRKFFGTLYNTYSFFALYANIDDFSLPPSPPLSGGVSGGLPPCEGGAGGGLIPYADRPELDRWVISKLNSLIKEVTFQFDDYDPTRAARAIQYFVSEELSNWYVRLARRRFWKGEMNADKQSAYQTLFECLLAVAQLMSPIAPFFSDWLYKNLTDNIRSSGSAGADYLHDSIHLTRWQTANETLIDAALEHRMGLAQEICSLVRSIRRKTNIKVRIPLQRILVPVISAADYEPIKQVEDLIRGEINVKAVEPVTDAGNAIVKKIKPQFKVLGPKLGPKLKEAGNLVAAMTQDDIAAIQKEGVFNLTFADGSTFALELGLVDITVEDLPGWSVASNNGVTVALDITLTEELKQEGIARELINRIQNLRKDLDFDVTDRISIQIEERNDWKDAIINFESYIRAETLADEFKIVAALENGSVLDIDGETCKIIITKK